MAARRYAGLARALGIEPNPGANWIATSPGHETRPACLLSTPRHLRCRPEDVHGCSGIADTGLSRGIEDGTRKKLRVIKTKKKLKRTD
jgi:hypothetical protein